MKKNISLEKPLKKTLSLINNKHKIEILYNLNMKTMRFGEIKTNIDTITQQLLTKQLKQLEKDNIIIRKKYNGFPRKVEYSLSTFGKSLKPILNVIKKWEEKNIKIINNQLKKRNMDSLFDYY